MCALVCVCVFARVCLCFTILRCVCCSRVGRVQPFISQLLHGAVDKTEQPMSPMPAGLGHPEDRKIAS
jgi:hypothetical protein